MTTSSTSSSFGTTGARATEVRERAYIDRGKQQRELMLVIERAMENGILTHIRDAKMGSIWVVGPDSEDVVVALQELRNSEWRFMGLGIRQSEKNGYMV